MSDSVTERVSRLLTILPWVVLPLQLIAADPSEASAETWTVRAGMDLQSVLNTAKPGDEIILQAGERFVGGFWLPPNPAGPPITIRSSGSLPDRRLTPGDGLLLATLASGGAFPAVDASGASNWKLDGLRFEGTTTGEGEIILLQDSAHIIMDRLLIEAGPAGQKRAIRGNGQHVTLTRSHIANIWRVGQESQAFCAWDGAGPYIISDNYLEAASVNVMFGGADSGAPDRVPSDIVIENNYFKKHPEWVGQGRVVKNLFELKQAKRVTVRDNLFEGAWSDAQSGYAILLTVRNDQGGAPWAAVEDVVFERNVIRDADAGVNILGHDDSSPSGQTTRITFRDNLFVLRGQFLLVGGEAGILTFDHNTVRQGGAFATLYRGEIWPTGESPRTARVAAEALTFSNTLANHDEFGVFGDGLGAGHMALTEFTGTCLWTHNVLAGESGWQYVYPAITWQPSAAEHAAQFNPDSTLIATSSYRGAGNDGQDLGFRVSAAPAPPLSGTGDLAPHDPAPEPVELEITTTSPLPTAVGRQPYEVQFSATLPGTWEVVQGSLPEGLTLDSAGVLSGTPQRRQIAEFTIQVSNASGSAAATYQLQVTRPDWGPQESGSAGDL